MGTPASNFVNGGPVRQRPQHAVGIPPLDPALRAEALEVSANFVAFFESLGADA